NGDGFPDIVVTSATGPVQKVKVFDGHNGALLRTFSGAPRNVTGGVHVAAGDLNGDGKAEAVIGAGQQVAVFDASTGQKVFRATPLGKKSVRVAVADLNGDGVDEFLVLTKNGSLMKAFNGRTFQTLPSGAITLPLGQILSLASQ